MPFPNPETQFKPGESGNPLGPKKGTKHISTWIQELLNDEDFTASVSEGAEVREYKGAPLKAIILAQVRLALNGDTKAFDALGKYGWGTKTQLSGDPDNPLIPAHEMSEEELRVRLKQIVAAGEGRSVSHSARAGSKKS